MSILSRPLTYDDLERARDACNERVELIEGELFVTPAPSLGHQDVIGNLYVVLRRAVYESGLGRIYLAPVDVRLDELTIIQPDLVVVLSDRHRILTSPRVEGAPSLAVEIISPSTRAYDRVTKRDLYARYGVPEYWLVDAEAETVTIFSDPRDGRYLAQQTTSDVAVSATIPGLSADMTALFAQVPGL